MAFRFSLEQVLRYRKQLEEEAMLALAVARRDLEECEAFIRFVQSSLREQREKMSNPQGLGADERWLITGYIQGLTSDLELAVQRRLVLREEVDRCHATLVQRAQDSGLLEKLKTRQAERFAKAEQREEQKNYDEIATLRFVPASR